MEKIIRKNFIYHKLKIYHSYSIIKIIKKKKKKKKKTFFYYIIQTVYIKMYLTTKYILI